MYSTTAQVVKEDIEVHASYSLLGGIGIGIIRYSYRYREAVSRPRALQTTCSFERCEQGAPEVNPVHMTRF